MKSQILFSGKNRKNVNLSSVDLAHSMLSINRKYIRSTYVPLSTWHYLTCNKWGNEQCFTVYAINSQFNMPVHIVTSVSSLCSTIHSICTWNVFLKSIVKLRWDYTQADLVCLLHTYAKPL